MITTKTRQSDELKEKLVNASQAVVKKMLELDKSNSIELLENCDEIKKLNKAYSECADLGSK